MADNIVDLGNRSLPSNEAAEQMALAAIMVINSALDEMADFLRPEHFFYQGHPEIYAACLALRDQGRSVDAVTLCGVLEPDLVPNLPRYLSELQASVVSVLNAKDYALEVHDRYLRRQLIGAGQELISACHTPSVEMKAAEQAEIAQQRIADITHAVEMPNAGPRHIASVTSEVLDHLAQVVEAQGRVVGLSTGMEDLDHKLGGLQAPSLIVIAARPGMGKTALALNIAEHVSRQGDPVLFYSLEMGRAQLLQRLIADETGIGTDRQRGGPLNRKEYLSLASAAADLGGLPLLLDDGRERTVAAIRAHARRVRRQHGLALVIVDYIQLMVTGAPRDRVGELSALTRELKRLAGDLDVPVVALSQLSREVEKREDKRPLLSDLRESGSIEQDADQVLFIFREEQYLRAPKRRQNQSLQSHSDDLADYETRRLKVAGRAEFLIEKNRHGPIGMVLSRWNGARQRFSNWLEHDPQEDLI